MTTVQAYIANMRAAQKAIAAKMGCDIFGADKQTRVAVLAGDAIAAVLAKTLVDNGIITNAALTAVMDAALADLYDDEPIEPTE
jgi:sugar (pentulose or hexulose) kinase